MANPHSIAVGGGTPSIMNDLDIKNEFSIVIEDKNENLLSKVNSKTSASCRKQTKNALNKHTTKKDKMIDVTKNFFDRNKLYLKSAIEY